MFCLLLSCLNMWINHPSVSWPNPIPTHRLEDFTPSHLLLAPFLQHHQSPPSIETFQSVNKCWVISHLKNKLCGEGNGNPLQYSCLENPMDRGAWQATAHGVTDSDMTERLHFLHFHFRDASSFLHCIGCLFKSSFFPVVSVKCPPPPKKKKKLWSHPFQLLPRFSLLPFSAKLSTHHLQCPSPHLIICPFVSLAQTWPHPSCITWMVPGTYCIIYPWAFGLRKQKRQKESILSFWYVAMKKH